MIRSIAHKHQVAMLNTRDVDIANAAYQDADRVRIRRLGQIEPVDREVVSYRPRLLIDAAFVIQIGVAVP